MHVPRHTHTIATMVIPRYWPVVVVVVVYFSHSRLKQLAQARAEIKTSLYFGFQLFFVGLTLFGCCCCSLGLCSVLLNIELAAFSDTSAVAKETQTSFGDVATGQKETSLLLVGVFVAGSVCQNNKREEKKKEIRKKCNPQKSGLKLNRKTSFSPLLCFRVHFFMA